ncbi:RNA polymerase II C-terminal domain phosphatase-like 4 [Silene latifolia]|uniref:RNA polymerase II C-terminal domain phosphatase-like 4 n=1 Tax=Silene latifolia TaxID=37657 RepID=UPI003D771851
MESLSVDSIRRIRDLNLQFLMHRKKLHLVLDLDNTLIHAINANNNKSTDIAKHDDIYEILKGEMLVKLRPGARDFLRQVSKMFDLSIYTMADQPYAREIAKILEEPDTVRFTKVISKEDCTKTYRKGLDVVLSHQRVVLIVDDLDTVWEVEDRDNLIKIQPYTFFHRTGFSDYDDELARVLGLLKAVHAKFFEVEEAHSHDDKDVRHLLKKVMRE